MDIVDSNTSVFKVLLLSACALIAASASAEVVSVADFSFESPDAGVDLVTATAEYQYNPPSTWLRWGSGGWGIQDWKDSAFAGANGNLSELATGLGYQSAFVNDGSIIYQNVGPILPATTYTLTVAVGNRLDKNYADTITLSFYNGDDLNGTWLTSATSTLTPDAGAFRDASVSFTTPDTVSGNLVIAISNQSGWGGHTTVDNVRLTTSPRTGTIIMISSLGSWCVLASGFFFFNARKRNSAKR